MTRTGVDANRDHQKAVLQFRDGIEQRSYDLLRTAVWVIGFSDKVVHEESVEWGAELRALILLPQPTLPSRWVDVQHVRIIEKCGVTKNCVILIAQGHR